MNKIFWIVLFMFSFVVAYGTKKKKDTIKKVEIFCLNIRANTPYNIDCSRYFKAFEKENILNFCLTDKKQIEMVSKCLNRSEYVANTGLDIRGVIRIYYSSSRIDSLCLPSESHRGLYLYNNVQMKFNDSSLLKFIDSLQRTKLN